MSRFAYCEEEFGKTMRNWPSATYLVAGEDSGSKLDRARALNVPVLDEPSLRALLNPPQ